MENLHVKIEQVNGNELTIREGQALPPVAPKKIVITGDIKTVASFVAKRNDKLQLETAGYQWINPDRAIVEVDRTAKTITLSVDPEDAYGPVVTAGLEANPDLEKFAINKNKTFKQKELVELIKFSRLYFDNKDKYEMLLKSYMAFNAKAYIEMASAGDDRSNKSTSFKKTVETDLPADFVLKLPIFKGQEPKSFHVEICFEVTDGGCNFWFSSVQLAELTEIESEAILNKELESCADYVVIWK